MKRATAARAHTVREAIGRCRKLIRERGEASSAAAARAALASYLALDEDARERFFDALAREFSPSPSAVLEAARSYDVEPSPANLLRLQEIVEPVRQELFRRLNMAPGGTAALVQMRKRVLRGLQRHPRWRVIDDDLRHLLRSWFNRGFLTLERIDWRTPAVVLEKLIEYEAVHQIQGWDDLRRRLAADRRCFAYFHPQLAHEPLIFIEVALTRGISARVQPLLDIHSEVTPPEKANCAVFYSVTNCQEGLRGISFGSFLIKQVATELRAELPNIRRFATLSPIPRFRGWLQSQQERLCSGAQGEAWRALFERLDAPEWPRSEAAAGAEALLLPAAAYYLAQLRRGDGPYDSVAHFHLGNGAVLERLNWMGDTSPQGIERSFGIMSNYVYRLNEVERNHELFVNEHRLLVSASIAQLAARAAPWLGDAARPRRDAVT